MRGEIGYDGLLMSDDVSMKALGGPYEERAAAIFEAGLDMVLHCNGELDEARAVASVAPELSGEALRRAETALASCGAPESFDLIEAEAKFATIAAALGTRLNGLFAKPTTVPERRGQGASFRKWSMVSKNFATEIGFDR